MNPAKVSKSRIESSAEICLPCFVCCCVVKIGDGQKCCPVSRECSFAVFAKYICVIGKNVTKVL